MTRIELHCTPDLALILGAIRPETMAHHREMKNAGDLLVRDIATSLPMFWAWQMTPQEMAAARLTTTSSQ
jgi:hypothetical protein